MTGSFKRKKPLKVRDFAKRYGCLTVATAGLFLSPVPSVFANVIDLGSAAGYAVVGVGGSVMIQSDFKLYQSATVINGNVAEGPPTTLDHGIDATVHGRWDYDLTDANPAASGYTGNVTGGFHQVDLSGVAADARAASAAAAAFAPTQIFSSLSNGQTIIGNAGVNVIRITGDSTIKTFLTLQGTATSTFIFQFTSATTAGHSVLTLSGMTMNLVGGVQANNIYWNFNGHGGDINVTSMAVGQKVYGNFLAPDRNITVDHGIVLGRLIGGGSGSLLNIHSGSMVSSPPPSVPDGGSTLFLFSMAVVVLMRFGKRRLAELARS